MNKIQEVHIALGHSWIYLRWRGNIDRWKPVSPRDVDVKFRCCPICGVIEEKTQDDFWIYCDLQETANSGHKYWVREVRGSAKRYAGKSK